MNNPINNVDGDGRDVWEIDKEGHIEWKDNSETHRLYSINEDGSRSNNYVEVENRDILDQLTMKRENYEGNYAVTQSSEVGSVFVFASNNSNVEWGLSAFEGNEFVLSTSHKTGSVFPATSIIGFDEKNMTFKIHSHPGVDGTKGASYTKHGGPRTDMHNIIDMSHRYNKAGIYTAEKFPKHFVYHSYTNILYQYTPYTNSLNIGTVNKNVINRVKSSPYSSVYYPR